MFHKIQDNGVILLYEKYESLIKYDASQQVAPFISELHMTSRWC